MDLGQAFTNFINEAGIMQMTWQQGVMLLVSCFLLYLAIARKFEPLLLLPIAFGMLLANLPGADLGIHYSTMEEFAQLAKCVAFWITCILE